MCHALPRIANHTPLLIVQHPREQHHPFGTTVLLQHALERVEVEVVWSGGSEPVFESGDVLLYPDPEGVCLSELPEPPRRLVVLDGTWHHARRLFRDYPGITELPRVRIEPRQPSRYRVRREPSAECLSTLEAVVVALRALEPETSGLDALLEAFELMNTRQLGLAAERRGVDGRRKTRVAPQRAFPAALRDGFERCVVVFGESAAPAPGDPPPDRAAGPRAASGSRQPLYFTAVRAATGEVFAFVVGTGVPRPSAWHLEQMGLEPAALDTEADVDALRRAWWDFWEPEDLVVAWNRSSLDLARVLGVASGIELKRVYCNLTRGPCGALEDVVVQQGLAVAQLPLLGRAAARVAGTLAVLLWLREQDESRRT